MMALDEVNEIADKVNEGRLRYGDTANSMAPMQARTAIISLVNCSISHKLLVTTIVAQRLRLVQKMRDLRL
jgi:hypothetical protein